MPYADSHYERNWQRQAKGWVLHPVTPTVTRRVGVCIERRVAGCMCVAVSAYDSLEFGSTEFHDLTAGTPVNGVSWAKGLDGACRCGKDVVYDQYLLVTGEQEVPNG